MTIQGNASPTVVAGSTAIVAPAHLGGREEIRGVRERLLSMIPGAADLPKEVVLAAAQIAVVYRLDPIMGEIVIARMGSKKNANSSWSDVYVPIITLKGYRTLARRQSNYTLSTRYMGQDEVETFRGNLFHVDDVGAEVVLWRLDLASECKRAGIEYHPSVGMGFWRFQAKAKKDKDGMITHYTPDELPETWTRHHVAEKRAESNALKKAFDLQLPSKMYDDGYDIDAEAVEILDAQDRATAIVEVQDKIQIEDDGEIIYAREPSRQRSSKDPQSGKPEPSRRNSPEGERGSDDVGSEKPDPDLA